MGRDGGNQMSGYLAQGQARHRPHRSSCCPVCPPNDIDVVVVVVVVVLKIYQLLRYSPALRASACLSPADEPTADYMSLTHRFLLARIRFIFLPLNDLEEVICMYADRCYIDI